jgi:hypothetical protein
MLVSSSGIVDLLVILVRLVVDNVEEAELVDTLGGGNDAEPVTELLLLEELLGAVIALAHVTSVASRKHQTYRYFR